jgi:hypothetical protein
MQGPDRILNSASLVLPEHPAGNNAGTVLEIAIHHGL